MKILNKRYLLPTSRMRPSTLQRAYDKKHDIQRELKRIGKKNVQQAGIKERYFELNTAEAVTKEEKRLKLSLSSNILICHCFLFIKASKFDCFFNYVHAIHSLQIIVISLFRKYLQYYI